MTKNELKKKMNTLLKYLIKRTNDVENQKELTRRIVELENKQYKVAVVANMSAGKSTFINALLGADVLPTSTEATTDCATYIYTTEGEKKAKIYFSEEVNKAPETLGEDRLKELWKYAKKDVDCENPKHKNVERINLYYPLKLLSENSENMEFEIVFIDTPGPNSKGGDYAEKHKNATRQVLNEANLALYLLDYSQLDALFDNDKQGLWRTIGERKKNDKHFEVFFIINKIDEALKNLANDLKEEDYDEEDDAEAYRKAKREKWGKHEDKAIQKVAIQVKEHFDLQDNEIIKVFCISSYYQILHSRQNKLNEDDMLEYKAFKGKFRGLANIEQAMIEHIGFERLQNEIQHFLNKEAQNGIINPLLNSVQNIMNDIDKDLKIALANLAQPQKEAEENLKKGKHFLQEGCKTLQENMGRDIKSIQEKAENKINALFDEMMKDCKEGIPDCVVRAVIFLLAYVEGKSIENAKEASMQPIEKGSPWYSFVCLPLLKKKLTREDYLQPRKISFDKATRNKDDIHKQLGIYISEAINDIRRDLLDMQCNVRQIYDEFNRQFNDCFSYYKSNISKELGRNLGVKCEDIPIHDTHIDLPCDMDLLSGNVSFTYKEAEYITIDHSAWYKPWTWVGDWTERVKVSDEKNYIHIDPKSLQEKIEQQILQNLDDTIKQAKKVHKANIHSQGSINSKLLKDFVAKQNENIKELERNRRDIEKSKKKCEEKYRAFQNVCNKINMKVEEK